MCPISLFYIHPTRRQVTSLKQLKSLFDEDVRRVYLNDAFLVQTLGLTNVDSVGQSGLESAYETLLRGREGSLRTEVDARSRLLPDGKTAYVAPQPGYTLRLTVDSAIQGIVEKVMRECLAVNSAKSVQCIVMWFSWLHTIEHTTESGLFSKSMFPASLSFPSFRR